MSLHLGAVAVAAPLVLTLHVVDAPHAASTQANPLANAQVIKASVPLSEMFGYATDLRSMTQGRADFTMQFDRYEEVPQAIASDIIDARS